MASSRLLAATSYKLHKVARCTAYTAINLLFALFLLSCIVGERSFVRRRKTKTWLEEATKELHATNNRVAIVTLDAKQNEQQSFFLISI